MNYTAEQFADKPVEADTPPPRGGIRPDAQTQGRMDRDRKRFIEFVVSNEIGHLEQFAMKNKLLWESLSQASGKISKKILSFGKRNRVTSALYIAQQRDSQRIRNSLAPRLAPSWTPLADHLNRSAYSLTLVEANLSPEDPPELRQLLAHTKLRLIQRFRDNLWQCRLIWCHMTSNTPPPPPDLPDPVGATTAAH